MIVSSTRSRKVQRRAFPSLPYLTRAYEPLPRGTRAGPHIVFGAAPREAESVRSPQAFVGAGARTGLISRWSGISLGYPGYDARLRS
jgi:hypothetical protein